MKFCLQKKEPRCLSIGFEPFTRAKPRKLNLKDFFQTPVMKRGMVKFITKFCKWPAVAAPKRLF